MPLHGASTSTRSNGIGNTYVQPSPCTTCTECTPRRSSVVRSVSTRCESRSSAHTSPSSPIRSARCVLFPPGAAHMSSTRSCASGATTRPTRASLSSCAVQSPARKQCSAPGEWCPSTHTRSGDSAAARASTPSRASSSINCSRVFLSVLARSPVGTLRLSATSSARVSAGPKRASQRSTIHSGCEPQAASETASSPSGQVIVARSSARRRSTLFTSPAAPGCAYLCASFTDSSTAACIGTRSRNRI